MWRLVSGYCERFFFIQRSTAGLMAAMDKPSIIRIIPVGMGNGKVARPMRKMPRPVGNAIQLIKVFTV